MTMRRAGLVPVVAARPGAAAALGSTPSYRSAQSLPAGAYRSRAAGTGYAFERGHDGLALRIAAGAVCGGMALLAVAILLAGG